MLGQDQQVGEADGAVVIDVALQGEEIEGVVLVEATTGRVADARCEQRRAIVPVGQDAAKTERCRRCGGVEGISRRSDRRAGRQVAQFQGRKAGSYLLVELKGD